jgi:hypothetical protein
VKTYESNIQKIFRLCMASCLIIVMIIVSLFKIKLAHYSVLAYFPISYFAAYSIRYIIEEGKEIKKIIYVLFALGALIWTTCLVLLPITKANLNVFEKYIHELKWQYPDLIISGDYNICHKPIDIHDPISNKNSSGFLPEEREWMQQFMNSGFTDTFRHFNKAPHQYSWWSYRANARNNNKGWRIDYCLSTSNLDAKLLDAGILPNAKHSDHCPVWVELEA